MEMAAFFWMQGLFEYQRNTSHRIKILHEKVWPQSGCAHQFGTVWNSQIWFWRDCCAAGICGGGVAASHSEIIRVSRNKKVRSFRSSQLWVRETSVPWPFGTFFGHQPKTDRPGHKIWTPLCAPLIFPNQSSDSKMECWGRTHSETRCCCSCYLGCCCCDSTSASCSRCCSKNRHAECPWLISWPPYPKDNVFQNKLSDFISVSIFCMAKPSLHRLTNIFPG